MTKIDVTDWHITTGQSNSCRNCPVANAITPILPAGQYAWLDEGFIQIRDAANRILRTLAMPESVRDFIENFDFSWRRDRAKPFSFDLDL